MKKIKLLSVVFLLLLISSESFAVKKKKYSFDQNGISREVLENYLDRSITMGYFLVPGKPEGYEFPYREDNIRMITCPNETLRTYFANTKSAACPVGYSQEETIKKIWKSRLK